MSPSAAMMGSTIQSEQKPLNKNGAGGGSLRSNAGSLMARSLIGMSPPKNWGAGRSSVPAPRRRCSVGVEAVLSYLRLVSPQSRHSFFTASIHFFCQGSNTGGSSNVSRFVISPKNFRSSLAPHTGPCFANSVTNSNHSSALIFRPRAIVPRRRRPYLRPLHAHRHHHTSVLIAIEQSPVQPPPPASQIRPLVQHRSVPLKDLRPWHLRPYQRPIPTPVCAICKSSDHHPAACPSLENAPHGPPRVDTTRCIIPRDEPAPDHVAKIPRRSMFEHVTKPVTKPVT